MGASRAVRARTGTGADAPGGRRCGRGGVHRPLGSSAVLEAVDEALAQIVAVGGHLAEPNEVKALWITCARRRVIDEERSAESRHRGAAGADGSHIERVCAELTELTQDERQWWRVQEILGVLRGDQRRWAEAWFDEVLSASHRRGGQPRGLRDALGWTPAKTKCVSRRARMKMAAFIDERARGTICDERQALLDAFIVGGRDGGGERLDDARREVVLLHLAGCDDCWAAWHSRRRALLGRCRAVALVPLDAAAIAGHALSEKLAGLAAGVHLQTSALLTRVGVGGAAAAGGGAVTMGGKVAATCVGLVCAATAGGELVGVLPPIEEQPLEELRTNAAHSKRAGRAASAARHDVPKAAAQAATRPMTSPAGKLAVRRAPRTPRVRPASTFTGAASARSSSGSGRSASFSGSPSGPPPATSGSDSGPTTSWPSAASSPQAAPPPATGKRPDFCAAGSSGC